jgi:hypothetical protein
MGALNEVLGMAPHMRFTDLVLHPHLIGHRFKTIGIVSHSDLRAHALSNRLKQWLERLDILRRHTGDRSG